MAKTERLHIGGKPGLHSTSLLVKKKRQKINHVPELICPITFLVSLGIVQLLPRRTFIHSFIFIGSLDSISNHSLCYRK